MYPNISRVLLFTVLLFSVLKTLDSTTKSPIVYSSRNKRHNRKTTDIGAPSGTPPAKHFCGKLKVFICLQRETPGRKAWPGAISEAFGQHVFFSLSSLLGVHVTTLGTVLGGAASLLLFRVHTSAGVSTVVEGERTGQPW